MRESLPLFLVEMDKNKVLVSCTQEQDIKQETVSRNVYPQKQKLKNRISQRRKGENQEKVHPALENSPEVRKQRPVGDSQRKYPSQASHVRGNASQQGSATEDVFGKHYRHCSCCCWGLAS